jgi:hypothetical protein
LFSARLPLLLAALRGVGACGPGFAVAETTDADGTAQLTDIVVRCLLTNHPARDPGFPG